MAWIHQELKRPGVTLLRLGLDLASWIGAHVRMVEYVGGCPAIFVPDNLRSGVTQAWRYEPIINRTHLEYVVAVLMLRRGRSRVESRRLGHLDRT